MPEKFPEYIKRKMSEIEELVGTAKNHPDIVSNFSISDTIVKDPMQMIHPIKKIHLEINEMRYNDIKEKK